MSDELAVEIGQAAGQTPIPRQKLKLTALALFSPRFANSLIKILFKILISQRLHDYVDFVIEDACPNQRYDVLMQRFGYDVHFMFDPVLLEFLLDDTARTAPSWAFKRGHQAVVELLLQHAANETTADADTSGETLVTSNTEISPHGMSKIQKLYGKDNVGLSVRGVNAVPMRHVISGTPLSIGQGYVQVMVMRGRKEDYDKLSVLWRAIALGDSLTANGIANGILDECPNIQALNTVGQTALCWTAEHGSNAIVELLLDRGIDCELPSYDGQTPLSWAAGHGRDSTVRLLLARGSYIERPSKIGQTPLSWAAMCGQVRSN